jgi:aspartyl-tRNA synthetase
MTIILPLNLALSRDRRQSTIWGMERTLARDTVDKIGEKILLKGWVQAQRDHGKLVFVDLRDRSGLVQLVGGEDMGSLGSEDVVEIEGSVERRPENLVNPNLATGKVEVKVQKIKVISTAAELPFPIDTDGYEIDETVRNKYRYLDLRRPRLARNLRVRSQVAQFMRQWLAERDFVEIETPILTKTTPEGARDFLVPSRLQPGKFYALPQSPQQYKQLLMVAGLERYFQIARCFRDEDPRKDRAYGEFTQLDIEMSFVTQADILQLIEELFSQLVKEIFPDKKISQSPWPRIPHKEAMAKYGTDKPDLRQDKQNADELAFAWTVDFPLFTQQSKEDFFYGSGQARFAPSHHMFTAPHPEDIPLLDSDPLKVRGLQHDLVLNGFEIGGGSIRIHQPEIQKKVFELIGFTDQQKQQFSHMLTAFTYGVPPHGGIAPGVDRFVYVALGEPNIREVMAFPTSASGQTAVVDAPSEATAEQLKESGIKLA